jgi:hypothetical protein
VTKALLCAVCVLVAESFVDDGARTEQTCSLEAIAWSMTPDARELWPPPAVDTIDRGARRRLGRRRRRRDRSDWANAKLCCRGAAPRGIDDEVAETLDDEPLPLERADASVPWENVSLALLRTRWSRSAPERRDAVGSWAAARGV